MKISSKKQKALKLVRQAQGMLTRVMAMIEHGEYCPGIIQQVDSTCGFLKSAKRELLAGHLDTCTAENLKKNKDQAIKELLKIYNLSN